MKRDLHVAEIAKEIAEKNIVQNDLMGTMAKIEQKMAEKCDKHLDSFPLPRFLPILLNFLCSSPAHTP